MIWIELKEIKIRRKNKRLILHRLFLDDDESIAKQDIKLTISSSTNFVFDPLISFKRKNVFMSRLKISIFDD